MPPYREHPGPCPRCGRERHWYYRKAGTRQAICDTCPDKRCRRRRVAKPEPPVPQTEREAYYALRVAAGLPLFDETPFRVTDLS